MLALFPCSRCCQPLLQASAQTSSATCSPALHVSTRDPAWQRYANRSHSWAARCPGRRLLAAPSRQAGAPGRCAASAGSDLVPWWVNPAAQPSAAALFVGILLLGAYSTWDLCDPASPLFGQIRSHAWQRTSCRCYAVGYRRQREAERRQAGPQSPSVDDCGEREEVGAVASAPGKEHARSPLEGVIRALTATKADVEGSGKL